MLTVVAKIDAANPVLAASARDPAVVSFAKAYAKALRGNYRAKGPTSADERANAAFRDAYRLVTYNGVVTTFKAVATSRGFRVARSFNGIGATSENHVVTA